MSLEWLYDEHPDAEDGDEIMETSELGIEKHYIFSDGEWGEVYSDPGWDHIYDGDGSCVSCPNCNSGELRYHNGQGCCLDCDSVFSDDELNDLEPAWHT